ncbi:hypothetical protein SHKM778_45860 [Streptomyces sp. KM77-8]|uniref:Tn3 transposase DDE domain-containing protein n=1 Tax=Streptomyces haneummycinicus TaxID=3074435 RepID=A0AAT9HLQ7_9ACTN
MRGFVRLLVEVIDFGAVEAGAPVVQALERLPDLIGRKKVGAEEVAADLVTGSWRRLVFDNRNVPHGLVDKAAYSFCVLEHLHRSLRRRDVFAKDGDRWGDPVPSCWPGRSGRPPSRRCSPLSVWRANRPDTSPKLASALHAAYVQVAAGLPGNTALEVVGGKLKLGKLGKAEEPKLMPPFRQLVNGMLAEGRLPRAAAGGRRADGDGGRVHAHLRRRLPHGRGFTTSLCAVLLTEACNVGFTPVIKPDVPALSRGRLVQVDHGYFRAENISVANGLFIEAQAKIDVVRAWGGGLVASADGVRFTVPVQTLYAGSNPRYFGLRHKGATWLNVVHDQVMGLGGVVVPGTLRDSLFILDAIHARDGGPKPETVITDTASYSDIVFGLFAICGYQFSPRIADISDARLWRANTAADYGPLQPVSNHTIRLDRIRAHWGDMLRVAGSLAPGEVRGHDLIRMLSRDGKPTGLGDAFAHYGTDLQDPAPSPVRLRRGYRRMIGAQLNVTEARHRLARKIFFGQRDELGQHYREEWRTSSAPSDWPSTA